MDEEKILKEEQNLTTDKMIATIRQKGATQVTYIFVCCEMLSRGFFRIF